MREVQSGRLLTYPGSKTALVLSPPFHVCWSLKDHFRAHDRLIIRTNNVLQHADMIRPSMPTSSDPFRHGHSGEA